MSEIYNNKIVAKIGRIEGDFSIEPVFPVVGQDVTLKAKMKWAESCEWNLNDGLSPQVIQVDNIINQENTQTLPLLTSGKFSQILQVVNNWNPDSKGIKNILKNIYCIPLQSEPYFEVSVNKEIIRNDGETCTISVNFENGYNPTTNNTTVFVKVYRENEDINPVISITGNTFTYLGIINNISSYCFETDILFTQLSDRGIYDIEVEVINNDTSVSFTKRKDKLVTVTPALTNKTLPYTLYQTINTTKCFTNYSPNTQIQFTTDIYKINGEEKYFTELIIPSGSPTENYYSPIDISLFPAGTTVILKNDPLETNPLYTRKLVFKGNKPHSVSSENGTPQFTWEKPLIITIDQNTPYHIPFIGYNGINFENNVRNIVFDGRGYQNIEKGIKIYKGGNQGVIAIWGVNGTSNIEYFEIEVSNTDFAGWSIKTDPNVNRPWYWYGNFSFDKLSIHHCYTHDVLGEGVYLGYFSSDIKQGTNSSGQVVTYRAHSMDNVRLYSNTFENTYLDAIQLNNGRNCEIYNNVAKNSGWGRQQEQASGMSLSFTGKIYNNIIDKFFGPGIQINPLGETKIFNNIILGGLENAASIYFLFGNSPENIVDGDINISTYVYIYNNTFLNRGNAIASRNTTTFRKIFIQNNFITYKNNIIAGQSAETLAIWESQMEGNISKQYNIIDYTDIDNTYLIANSIKGDFRLSHLSPLSYTGTGNNFEKDFNGYKPMVSGKYPVGPFQPIIRNPSIVSNEVFLTDININNNAIETTSRNVNVYLNMEGSPLQYKIGEGDITSNPWINYTVNPIPFTLSEGIGVKTISVQLKNSNITQIESDSITLVVPESKTIIAFNINNYNSNSYIDNDGEIVNSMSYAYNEYVKNFQLKDTNNNNSGIFIAKPSMLPEYADRQYFREIHNPSLSGNTGTYPDILINKHWGINRANYNNSKAVIRITNIEPGNYEIKILDCRGEAYTEPQSLSLYIQCNNLDPIQPEFVPINNTDIFTIIENVTVGEDGILDMWFYNVNNFYYMPGFSLIEYKRIS